MSVHSTRASRRTFHRVNRWIRCALLLIAIQSASGFDSVSGQEVRWDKWSSAARQKPERLIQTVPAKQPAISHQRRIPVISDAATRDFHAILNTSQSSEPPTRLLEGTESASDVITPDAAFAPQQIQPQLLMDPQEETAAADPSIWWERAVRSPMRPSAQTVEVTLESLLVQALEYSSQIRVYSDLPMIRKTSIVEAQAAFDPSAFLDSRWDDQNDPVGNALTTGGASRYKNNQFSGAAGLRQRTQTGGKLEISERVGFQDTNSIYFVPNPQGTSKLVLSFTQPLMRGRGKEYNQSLTVLAQIDKDIAED